MPEMSMRERVARAIREVTDDLRVLHHGGQQWAVFSKTRCAGIFKGDLSQCDAYLYARCADAVFATMRDITGPMIKATTYADSFAEAWSMAINAARSDGTFHE